MKKTPETVAATATLSRAPTHHGRTVLKAEIRACCDPDSEFHGGLPRLLRGQEEGSGRRGRVRLTAAADAAAFAGVRPLALLPGHRRPVIHLQFVPVSAAASAAAPPSSAAARLFSACSDGLLRLWSISAAGGGDGGGGGGGGGECVALVRGPAELSDARALAAGTVAACVGFDGSAGLFDLVAGRACR